MKLYTHAGSFRAQKVLIAAEFAGLDIEPVTEATKGKSPVGKSPVLETAQGNVFESNAIARFVARSAPLAGLMGSSFFASAQVDAWVDYVANDIEVPACSLVYPILGWMKNHPAVTKAAKADTKKAIMTLERHLKSNDFLVGDSVTLADIAAVTALLLPLKFVYAEKERKAFPSVMKWFSACVAMPQFSAVIGHVNLCVKPMVAAAPAKKEKKKQEKKKKEKKAAPAQPKKAKKPKNPLDALPKSSMSLDGWKTKYSNTVGDCYEAMPWFWENFDASGWSLFFQTYNYNSENTVAFMTSNLVGGFVQRCDAVRKYAFGTMQIIGDEAPFEIVGCWLIRGDSIQPLLDANPDAEYYTYTKVELTEENKKKVADLWCAEETLSGKKISDCKVFK